jgi:hypothetical protein
VSTKRERKHHPGLELSLRAKAVQHSMQNIGIYKREREKETAADMVHATSQLGLKTRDMYLIFPGTIQHPSAADETRYPSLDANEH